MDELKSWERCEVCGVPLDDDLVAGGWARCDECAGDEAHEIDHAAPAYLFPGCPRCATRTA